MNVGSMPDRTQGRISGETCGKTYGRTPYFRRNFQMTSVKKKTPERVLGETLEIIPTGTLDLFAGGISKGILDAAKSRKYWRNLLRTSPKEFQNGLL